VIGGLQLSVDVKLATTVRWYQSHEDIEQGTLSAAAWPDQRHELALSNGEVGVLERLDRGRTYGKRLRNVLCVDFRDHPQTLFRFR